jgi:hypothetical protein
VGVCRVTHDIDVFEAGTAIQPDFAQILSEKPDTFAEKKDSNELENNIAMRALLPKRALMKLSPRQRRTGSVAAIGRAATTSAIFQSCRFGKGGRKRRSVTFTLQIFLSSVLVWENTRFAFC